MATALPLAGVCRDRPRHCRIQLCSNGVTGSPAGQRAGAGARERVLRPVCFDIMCASWMAARTAHERWWRAFWSRSHVRIGAGANASKAPDAAQVSMQYANARYL